MNNISLKISNNIINDVIESLNNLNIDKLIDIRGLILRAATGNLKSEDMIISTKQTVKIEDHRVLVEVKLFDLLNEKTFVNVLTKAADRNILDKAVEKNMREKRFGNDNNSTVILTAELDGFSEILDKMAESLTTKDELVEAADVIHKRIVQGGSSQNISIQTSLKKTISVKKGELNLLIEYDNVKLRDINSIAIDRSNIQSLIKHQTLIYTKIVAATSENTSVISHNEK